MGKRTYKRRPNEAEKEALLCYRYYNPPGSYVYSIDDEKGKTAVVGEPFLFEKRDEKVKVYTDSVDDPPDASGLEDMRAVMFLSRPCGEEVESHVRSLMDSLPIFADEGRGDFALSYDPLAELGCEAILSVDLSEDADVDARTRSYCFPAGFTFNVAMESAAERLGIDGHLWELNKPRKRRLKAEFAAQQGQEGRELANRADTLMGMVNLVSALVSARGRFTWAVLNDWLDLIPYKPSSALGDAWDWGPLGKTMLESARRGARKPGALRTERLAGIDIPDTYEARTAEEFGHIEIVKNPRQIRCLMDVFYYTLRAFAVKNNHGNAYRCSSCGRLFFQYHGRQKYCLFRSPDPDYQSDSCQEAVKKVCAKRYNEVKRLRDVIANTLSKPHRESVYPDDDYVKFIVDYDNMSKALGRREDLDERLDRYAKQLEWLNDRYVKHFGRKYVPKEVKKK